MLRAIVINSINEQRLLIGTPATILGTRQGIMSVNRVLSALVLLCLLSLVSVLPADAPKPDDKEVVQSKATLRTPAASINFRKELGLPFQSLNTLGSRIDASRRAHDAVSLGNEASEPANAENVA